MLLPPYTPPPPETFLACFARFRDMTLKPSPPKSLPARFRDMPLQPSPPKSLPYTLPCSLRFLQRHPPTNTPPASLPCTPPPPKKTLPCSLEGQAPPLASPLDPHVLLHPVPKLPLSRLFGNLHGLKTDKYGSK